MNSLGSPPTRRVEGGFGGRWSGWDGLAVASSASALVAGALVYTRLPDPVPTHFDLAGTPNGFMARPVAAVVGPLVALAVWALVRFVPSRLSGDRSPGGPRAPLPVVAACTATFVAVMHVLALYAALTPGFRITRPTFVLLGVFFVLLGLLLPRVRRNAWVGVRTPWTLTSDENWARTHRVAGYTMVIGGVVAAFSGASGATAAPSVALGAIVVGALAPAVYSFLLSRQQRSG